MDNFKSEKQDYNESFEYDELERVFQGQDLQEELKTQLAELSILEDAKKQIDDPDIIGDVILQTIWEQFQNQIAVQAGEDFIKDNNGMHLDLRRDAHIQTTQNFIDGKIASHNTEIDYQTRYHDWQNNFQHNDDGSVKTSFDKRSNSHNAVLNKDARAAYDANRPKGSKTINKDHIISAAEIIRDPDAATHMTSEEKVAFANSSVNIQDLDSAANQSKGDLKTLDWLKSERDGLKPADRFSIDEEELKRNDRKARKEYKKQKDEAERRSIESGKKSQKAEALRISKKAVRAILMNMLANLVKKIIQRLVRWFKSASRNLNTLLEYIKDAVVSFVIELKNNVVNAVDSAFTVIATSIIGPVVSTIKKAWMLIKQGWSSMKEVVSYLKNPSNKNKPMGILTMEVGKIITVGMTAIGGIVLGEAIETGLSAIPLFCIEIPMFGSLANILGIFFGAVVAGVLGAIVLKLINNCILKRQEGDLINAIIDKGNEVITTQVKLQEENIDSFHLTKDAALNSISKRHAEATEIINESLEKIMNPRGILYSHELEEMQSKLIGLSEE